MKQDTTLRKKGVSKIAPGKTCAGSTNFCGSSNTSTTSFQLGQNVASSPAINANASQHNCTVIVGARAN